MFWGEWILKFFQNQWFQFSGAGQAVYTHNGYQTYRPPPPPIINAPFVAAPNGALPQQTRLYHHISPNSSSLSRHDDSGLESV